MKSPLNHPFASWNLLFFYGTDRPETSPSVPTFDDEDQLLFQLTFLRCFGDPTARSAYVSIIVNTGFINVYVFIYIHTYIFIYIFIYLFIDTEYILAS